MQNKPGFEDQTYENQSFEGLNLSQERLRNLSFIDCSFKGCVFEECVLEACSLQECSFEDCRFVNLKSEGSQLKYLSFSKCHLLGVQWQDFQSTGLIASPLHAVKDCMLRYNGFIGMNFKKFSFAGNLIADSIFENCRLDESSFKHCDLQNTQFLKCDLKKADFRQATGYNIDIMGSKLSGAKFSLPEAVRLLRDLNISLE